MLEGAGGVRGGFLEAAGRERQLVDFGGAGVTLEEERSGTETAIRRGDDVTPVAALDSKIWIRAAGQHGVRQQRPKGDLQGGGQVPDRPKAWHRVPGLERAEEREPNAAPLCERLEGNRSFLAIARDVRAHRGTEGSTFCAIRATQRVEPLGLDLLGESVGERHRSTALACWHCLVETSSFAAPMQFIEAAHRAVEPVGNRRPACFEGESCRMATVKFEEIDHTADLGLRIYGRDFAALLRHAAEGMFSLVDEAKFAEYEVETRMLVIEYDDREECLYFWLRALLAEFNKDGFFRLHVEIQDRKSTRLNSSHLGISYAVFCLKKKKKKNRKNSYNKRLVT